jgi:hypothetical protein
MSWSTRFVGLIVAVAALAACSTAFAGVDFTFNAKVRIVSGGDLMQYHGKVLSNVEECQVGRKIKIKSPGVKLGSAFTDAKGKFSIKDDAVEDGALVKFKLVAIGDTCPGGKVVVEI